MQDAPETPTANTDEQPRGFAAMEPDAQRAIAAEGGKAAHEKGVAHEFTKKEAIAAGKKGGQVVSQDREHMRAIGRKGGDAVSANREHMRAIGKRGGLAVSKDRTHMSKIGKKGARGLHASDGETR